jgi:16S rRNA (cytidine1402-2'-O)-methyltransferase
LFVIATPIGNLNEITPRAVQTLAECEVVCAEDTRRTRALLTHLQITGKRLRSLHGHSAERVVHQILEQLKAGAKVALVSDAGTPCVSDPGVELVHACHQAKLRVVGISGPSAVTTAVSASGLVQGAFTFLGFLPRSGTKRERALQRIVESVDPCVLFEAPNRLGDTLRELADRIGQREACVARELSKMHEELKVASLRELAAEGERWRGECTLIVAGRGEAPRSDTGSTGSALRTEIVTALRAGAGTKALADALAERTGRSRKEMYSLVLSCAEET